MALGLAVVQPAFGHAFLARAVPAVGGVTTSPPQVSCLFTEDLEPRFSTLEVQNAGGQRVDDRDLHFAPGDPRRMIVSLPHLAPGIYTVIWHALSVDTHRTEGRFVFTVTP